MIGTKRRVLFFATVTAVSLPAQRPEPTLEWQKRTTTITYGAVPVGKHSLAELPVGGEWRLGNNDASNWTLQMPILAGDAVLAPGQYRISMFRTDDSHCAIVAHGSHHALGGGDDVRVNGDLGKAGKPGKKLAIEWTKGAAGVNQPAQIVAQYGEHEWKAAVTLVGGKNATLPGWKLVVFTLPAASVAARHKVAVPVAALSRGTGRATENWNLVIGKDAARLVPWLVAPTDSYGFGDLKAPDQDAITVGKVAAQDATDQADHVDLKESSLIKGEFVLQLVAGKETLKVTVPEPKARVR